MACNGTMYNLIQLYGQRVLAEQQVATPVGTVLKSIMIAAVSCDWSGCTPFGRLPAYTGCSGLTWLSLLNRKIPRPCACPMGFMIHVPPVRLNSSTNILYSRGTTYVTGKKA